MNTITQTSINILGESIPVASDYLNIYELKFLHDNPRVYACTHSVPDFDDMPEEQQQEIIYDQLKKESSVKNLIPEVKRHEGLMEPILVRQDTKEVIEGNSRLAVFRHLNETNFEGEWDLIPCEIVSRLTDEQQAAYLNQIHVKGKTQWSAYEKANFAYVRYINSWPVNKIADLFGESVRMINKRINIIELMRENTDPDISRYSYYEVMLSNQKISREIKKNEELRQLLLKQVKSQGVTSSPPINEINDSRFTAQELRDKLPAIIDKPRQFKKFLDEKVDLDSAYQQACVSEAHKKVKKASDYLEISKRDLIGLERSELNAFKQAFKNLEKQVTRIRKAIEQVSS